MNTKLIGRWGEKEAANHLRGKGYSITAMGFMSRFGEIDIVAENRRFVAFVEVKTRKAESTILGREYVTLQKQRRIISTAKSWLAANPTDKQPRFDVIEVSYRGDNRPLLVGIEHIENAFDTSVL